MHLLRRLILTVLSVLAFARVAVAVPLYADLDRDGVRDLIAIDTAHRAGLNVWLSRTGTVSRINTNEPITGLITFDLDGDGHQEIVATDSGSRLHIWRVTPQGRVRSVQPRDRSRRLRAGALRLIQQEDDAVNDGAVERIPGSPGLETLRFHLSAPAPVGVWIETAFSRAAADRTAPPPSRGPPARS